MSKDDNYLLSADHTFKQSINIMSTKNKEYPVTDYEDENFSLAMKKCRLSCRTVMVHQPPEEEVSRAVALSSWYNDTASPATNFGVLPFRNDQIQDYDVHDSLSFTSTNVDVLTTNGDAITDAYAIDLRHFNDYFLSMQRSILYEHYSANLSEDCTTMNSVEEDDEQTIPCTEDSQVVTEQEDMEL